jgi:hypothetical protein
MKQTIHQLVHGYEKGHSLLAGSCSLTKSALEIVTEQSDLSGPLPSGVSIPSYLTAYPVPDTDFYALGRTWPDTHAPRSGCVITHTLLVPNDAWGTAELPRDYLGLHRRPDRKSLEIFKQELVLPEDGGDQSKLNWLTSPESDEFATKLFSEGLRSIIWFDCEAPDLLVMVLASLLWPSLRASLYANTFSLHPHAKVKSDLQLHFAPRSAQSYFSRVPKQCHMNRRPPGYRSEFEKEWTSDLSEDLRAGRPRHSYLVGLKQYGHLLGRDPSSVRSLFALGDLSNRLQHTPTAAIGILDIIDSLEPIAELAVKEKQIALEAALSAAMKVDVPTSLRCLSLVDMRLRRPSFAVAGIEAKSILKKTVEKFVANEPQSLVATCGQSIPSDDSIFWRAAVDGMRTAAKLRPQSIHPLRQSPAIGSFVISEAPSVASAYLRSSQDRRADSINELIHWLHHVERDDQRRNLRRELLPEIVDDESVPLLEELVRDISSFDVGDALSVLIESTKGFSSVSIRRVVTDCICQRFPMETIHWGQRLHLAQSKCVADLLADAFPLSIEGLERILDVDWMTPDDRCEVLSAFIERAAKKQLPKWFIWRAKDDVVIIETFARCNFLSPLAILALRTIGDNCDYLPIARSIYQNEFILKVAGTNLSDLFVPKLIDSAIAEYIGGRIDADRMLCALNLAPYQKFLAQYSRDRLYSLLSSTTDADSWQRAWITLSIIPPGLFKKVAGHQIIAEFSRSFRATWTENVANAWACVINRADDELSAEDAVRLFIQSTEFCLTYYKYPLGKVVVAAFPRVYEAVRMGKTTHVTDEMFGFFDWDKAKKLRTDLVETYMSSNWPPEELALIAARCEILRKIIHRLQRKWCGDEYIKKMTEGLRIMATPDAHLLCSELSLIVNDRDFFEPWD